MEYRVTPVLIEQINNFIFWTTLTFIPVWLIVEITSLLMRGAGWDVIPGTISMVMRDRAAHITAVIFFLSGMITHWWWNPPRWASTGGTVSFWVMIIVLLVFDIILWKRPVETWPMWLQTVLFPRYISLAGLLAGFFLFPQKGKSSPWG